MNHQFDAPTPTSLKLGRHLADVMREHELTQEKTQAEGYNAHEDSRHHLLLQAYEGAADRYDNGYLEYSDFQHTPPTGERLQLTGATSITLTGRITSGVKVDYSNFQPPDTVCTSFSINSQRCADPPSGTYCPANGVSWNYSTLVTGANGALDSAKYQIFLEYQNKTHSPLINMDLTGQTPKTVSFDIVVGSSSTKIGTSFDSSAVYMNGGGNYFVKVGTWSSGSHTITPLLDPLYAGASTSNTEYTGCSPLWISQSPKPPTAPPVDGANLPPIDSPTTVPYGAGIQEPNIYYITYRLEEASSIYGIFAPWTLVDVGKCDYPWSTLDFTPIDNAWISKYKWSNTWSLTIYLNQGGGDNFFPVGTFPLGNKAIENIQASDFQASEKAGNSKSWKQYGKGAAPPVGGCGVLTTKIIGYPVWMWALLAILALWICTQMCGKIY